MRHIPLIELSRGATLECVHFGSIAVVNTRGQLLAQAGNPYWTTFSRSTLKALQALPLLRSNGPEHFGFGSRDLALMCASHNGEAMHVAQAQSMLERIGLQHQALRCGCHPPLLYAQLEQAPPADLVVDQRHHNCSGKHVGFLAYCVQHGLSQDDYTEAQHPLQQAVRREVARVVGLRAEDLKLGIDGCSAPNYALPLAHLARGYARLASAGRDPEYGAAFQALSLAMTTHPELVSGTGRSDLAFMRAGRGDWVSKVGADGVQVVGSKSRGEALALKIIDGNKPALFAATVEALDQLGWLDDDQRLELEVWRARPIRNARGLLVGERQAAFHLQGAKV